MNRGRTIQRREGVLVEADSGLITMAIWNSKGSKGGYFTQQTRDGKQEHFFRTMSIVPLSSLSLQGNLTFSPFQNELR